MKTEAEVIPSNVTQCIYSKAEGQKPKAGSRLLRSAYSFILKGFERE